MVATTNIQVTPADGWVAIGDTLTYVAIQHLHNYKVLDMTFGDTQPSSSIIGHPLAHGEMESGLLGSQLWVKSPSVTITVIVTA